jgi:putative two-component system response regulator
MKKIVMIDDEPDQLFTMKRILESMSDKYEFIGAKNGYECLRLLQDGALPDLILLDIMMPLMSGWELFEKIKKNPEWKKIPIVFLTARTDEVAINAGQFLGDAYINKPYDVDDVIKIIKEKTDKKQLA